MKNLLAQLTLLILLLAGHCRAADNLVLITIDGLRWQEVFAGLDPAIVADETLTRHAERLGKKYGGSNAKEKRRRLMPFLWQTIARDGALLGNRTRGSRMQVTNPWWFSYPGYNEILSGKADPKIDSNDRIANRNVTFLEWLNRRTEFRGRVAAFASWHTFAAILNRTRSGLPVNAGFEVASWPQPSPRARLLSQLQRQTPITWSSLRYDAYTYNLAREYLLQRRPRMLYIALGETDDFAHDKQYDQYLDAAHRADRFIADLWQTLQSLPQYRDNTNLVITVDHGRGRDAALWPYHGSPLAVQKSHPEEKQLTRTGIPGSNEIWLAALGPDIRPGGEVSGGPVLFQNQVAATALSLLGEQPEDFSADIGPAIQTLLK
ncbi:alkaline phosphatase family protein [Microbulbifer sp. SAOS-129_SWC]|uniref:alkaline phosphatase family protein n=1 Tax=Microbulbifer sp. SAOS-129_SWC TaxID=3145235 RepID=UPI0032176C74